MRSARFGALLAVVQSLLCAAASTAQPTAATLQELKRLEANKVVVIDTTGREFRGTIADASASELRLQIGREIRRFDAVDLRSIHMRKEDSLANGALIGAAVGAGATSLIFLDNECHDDPACYGAVAVYGGLGALAGLIADALIHRTVVIYTAPPPTRPRVSVEPLGRAGLRLRIAF
jgi:hypothetical protein